MAKLTNTALMRIAATSRGASAVATRGGTRQLMRVLLTIAAIPTREADEVTLSMLQVLDTVASGGTEAADILRKQVQSPVFFD